MRPVCHWHQNLRGESGNVLVLVALCMTALMGFTALAVDVGLMFRAKRNLQIVADAAATAGALEYYNTGSGAGVNTAAQAAATANGVTNGVNGAVVTIVNPVTTGAHTGAATVEADVSQPNPTFFMKVFSKNSMTVSAKAVAGNVPGQACMYLMGPGDALSTHGKVTIQGYNVTTGLPDVACGMYIDNNYAITGNSTTINAAFVEAGGVNDGNHDIHPTPAIQNAPKQTVPKALQITPPDPSSFASCGPPAGATLHGSTYTANVTSLTPGTCYGFGTKSTLNITVSNATLAPGLYTFNLGTNGTLTLGSGVTGGSAAQGSTGVTFNVYTGDFAMSNSTDTLYAPSDGASDPYNGVLLVEPSTNTGNINLQWGSGGGKFYGMIVAPSANMTLQDNGGLGLVTGFVLGSLSMNGTLDLANYGDVYTNGPLRTIALLE